MAIIKCKMCGGDLEIIEGSTVCECTYCGTKQTVPSADNEKKLTLFARAGRLLRACEFDKASGVFEAIVADFPEEAEAYWGLVLCKYGIEYVDDPATGKKIPTCHRSSFENVEDDSDYEQACENADVIARRVYREEARQIETLRKRILEVSGKEEPYDVFISYKELDDNKERTPDSVIAQDIYRTLTKEGYRVFFSRISLEGKLGVEYEPYIFAALNSAKVMIVVGTDYEHFDAVWVKNEWSRFLKLIAKGEKKTLIPVYKDMDPYDMPKELRVLAAQDMGKIGAMQDLLHGVEKLLKQKEDTSIQQMVIKQQSDGLNIDILLGRGEMSLENSDWDKAKEFFDKALNLDVENAEAYLGLAMAEEKVKDRDALAQAYIRDNSAIRLKAPRFIRRARQFDPAIDEWFRGLDLKVKKREEQLKATEEEKRIAEEKEKARMAILEQGKRIEREKNKAKRLKQHDRAVRLGQRFSAGFSHSLGIQIDGTALAVGGNPTGCCYVTGWTNLVMIRADTYCSFGVLDNGQVLSTLITDDNCDYSQSLVGKWENIKQIACGRWHTVGLRNDGTVVSTEINSKGKSCGQGRVSGWKGIIEIDASLYHTLGLHSDGSVVASGNNSTGRCDTDEWRDIIQIAASDNRSFGLRSDGTVVVTPLKASPEFDFGEDAVTDWEEIIAISAESNHIIGLRSDGTVVACGDEYCGCCDVGGWHDIVAISTGFAHTLGLRSDGTLISTMFRNNSKTSEYGRTNVAEWKLFSGWKQFDNKTDFDLSNELKALEKNLASRGIFASKSEKTRAAQIREEIAFREKINRLFSL